jgi:hypothetical protein
MKKLIVEVKSRKAAEKMQMELQISSALCSMKKIVSDHVEIDLDVDPDMFAAVFQAAKRVLEARLKKRPKEVQEEIKLDSSKKS